MPFFFLRDNPNRDSCLLEYAEGVAKDDIELMNADQHETDKVTLCNALGALSQDPMSNSIMWKSENSRQEIELGLSYLGQSKP